MDHILDPENREFLLDEYLDELATPPPPSVRPNITNYSQHFIMELALGLESPDALCIRYDITPSEYSLLLANPVFQTDLTHWKSKMVDEGLSFKLKARIQAESYLEEIDELISDPTTSKETKLAAISRIVSWAGLEQSKTTSEAGSKPSVTINITRFSDNTQEAIEIK